jgi:hypothetical protein
LAKIDASVFNLLGVALVAKGTIEVFTKEARRGCDGKKMLV